MSSKRKTSSGVAETKTVVRTTTAKKLKESQPLSPQKQAVHDSKFAALLEIGQFVTKLKTPRELVDAAIPIFKKLTKADRCSVFLVDQERQVLRTIIAEGTTEICIPLSSGIVGHVISTRRPLNIVDAYDDDRFDRSVDSKTGYRTRSILCVPIVHPTEGIIGAIEMMNKHKGSTKASFDSEDEMLCSAFAAQVAVSLIALQALNTTKLASRRSDALLDILRNSSSNESVTVTLERVVSATHKLVDAELVLLFVVDSDTKQVVSIVHSGDTDISSIPINSDTIEGSVAATGRTVNVTNLADSRLRLLEESLAAWNSHLQEVRNRRSTSPAMGLSFENAKAVRRSPRRPALGLPRAASRDKVLPLVPTSVVCVAGMDRRGLPAAVLAAYNKAHTSRDQFFSGSQAAETAFTDEDVELMQSMAAEAEEILRRHSFTLAFESALEDNTAGILSLYTHETAGSRGNSKLRRNSNVSVGLNVSSSTVEPRSPKVADSLTTFVMNSSMHLRSPDFDAFNCSASELRGVVAAIFSALNLVERFTIRPEILHRFIMAADEGYLRNPYHNFQHGVSVLHCVFMMVTQGQVGTRLSPLEQLSLCVASLCHDIGHFGLNNTYLVNARHELALQYNDRSVLENMHASRTIRMLRESEMNVLQNLSAEEEKQARKIIIASILATDMADHYEIVNKVQKIVTENNFQTTDPKHMEVLLNALVHSADISNSIYETKIAVKWSRAISMEFNAQVQKEREGKLPPSAFLETPDEKALARMNVNFIQYIVHPLWKALGELVGTDLFKKFLANIEKNKQYWQGLLEEADGKAKSNNSSSKSGGKHSK